mgnify:FL=1
MLRTGFVGMLLLTTVAAANTVYLPMISKEDPPAPTATLPDTPTETPTPTATSTLEPPTPTATFISQPPTSTATTEPAVCGCWADLYNCDDFNTQADAQACFSYCISQGAGDVHKLDRDNDGTVCESLPLLFELWKAP